MPGSDSKTTTDHDTIKKWAEERGGRPASVSGSGDGDEPGVLRIDFEDGNEDRLDEISWDDFFEKFEESKLALLYQEETAGGDQSRFAKFVRRD